MVVTSQVELLEERALCTPDMPAFQFLTDGRADGRVETWSYGETARRARCVATQLQARGLAGERVLALFPSGLEFVAAFFGSLYAGTVPVPAYPPDPARLARTLPRLQAIAADARVAAVLTTSEIAGLARALASFAPGLARLEWIVIDPTRTQDDWRRPELHADALAFLQYTSGSTSAPKGVMVTHQNLVHQQATVFEAFAHRGGEVTLAWLPLFHDMGLIGHVLQALYAGGTSVLMSPDAFMRRPIEWLRAIQRFGAHTSGAPDFGYALCARKVGDEELVGLDLSCWQVAYCGAEPVRPATMRAFAERFATAGFRATSLTPCYGLAENTLMATCSAAGRGVQVGFTPVETARTRPSASVRARFAFHGLIEGERVGLGGCQGGELAIVDPDTRTAMPYGESGEIWLRGSNVAAGYWGQPELSAAVFSARMADGSGPWLRTGDRGRVFENGLEVSGRLKDLIIVRGRNLHAEDIEQVVEGCHGMIRPGCATAFGVEVEGEEQVVIVCETREDADPNDVAEVIRGAISSNFDAPVHAVVLLAQRALPKTSSGKRARQAARQGFLDGTLEEVGRVSFRGPQLGDAVDDEPAPTSLAAMQQWLARQAGRVLGRDPSELPLDVPLESLGLDSLRAVELASRLDARLERPLHASVFYSVPTIAALAAWLVEGGHTVDGAGAPDVLYPELSSQLTRLERRNPERYRFDIESDIPWARAGEPGIYVPREMFGVLGIDTAPIEAVPEAWAMLQAASAMTLCTAFEVVEVTITLFIDTRRSMLGATRSIELFREEEGKHVALFRRCAKMLAARHPDTLIELDWDPAWGVGFWELFRAPNLFPSEGVFHYLFWFFFTAFEEHSIYFAELLAGSDDAQPTWRAAHLAHRQEEIQHVATDHAYSSALDLPAEQRDAWSEVCVAWLCQHFETFFAFGPARRLVAERFPELAPHLRTRGFVRSPFLGELLSAPAFRRTRLGCPYLRELGELSREQLPTDIELARRLPANWLRENAVLVPDPVVHA
jgi:acyl-CoA synthetase (AMP-forming)/AMP-acid ligase II/acyl carrier protein